MLFRSYNYNGIYRKNYCHIAAKRRYVQSWQRVESAGICHRKSRPISTQNVLRCVRSRQDRTIQYPDGRRTDRFVRHRRAPMARPLVQQYPCMEGRTCGRRSSCRSSSLRHAYSPARSDRSSRIPEQRLDGRPAFLISRKNRKTRIKKRLC